MRRASNVAVIGSGISGALCASLLARGGVTVTVFESGRGPGGRMSQRRETTGNGEELFFDHGAPYFTVSQGEVIGVVGSWEARGLVAEWKERFGSFDKTTGEFACIAKEEETTKKYVGIPAMNSICKALCHESTAFTGSPPHSNSPGGDEFLLPAESGMSSSDNPEVSETEVREKGHKENEVREKGHKEKENKEEEKEGFIEKVKDFIHDIGEKIEEAIGFGKPTADVTGVHLPTINLKKVDIVVDVLITNPNPIPIPLIDINYLIDSEERKLVSGLIPDAGTIHAHGSETVKIPVTLIFDDIKSTYHEIKPGSIIPYRIKVDLIVDIPIFGRITLPLEKKGEIPIPYKPDVDVEKIRFAKFSFEETVADLHLKLENKNDFDLGLNMLDYEFWLCDESIASAELTQSIKIEKQGVCRMKIPISFKPKDFGSAIWDMIRGRGTGYSIKGNIDVDTPFGNMKLPISKVGGTTKLKKNKRGEDDDDSDSE